VTAQGAQLAELSLGEDGTGGTLPNGARRSHKATADGTDGTAPPGKDTRDQSGSPAGARLHGWDKAQPQESRRRMGTILIGDKHVGQDHNQAIELPETHRRLLHLVDYVRHMVQLGEKPVFALKEYRQLLYHEQDLKGRVGITHDLADEDGPVWLRVERLKRIDPPAVPEPIWEWIAVGRDPLKAPVTKTLRTVTLPRAEADRLVAEAKVDRADVLPTLKPDGPGERCDVIFRIERLADIQHMVHEYMNGPWARWAEEERPRRETIAIYDKLFALQQALESQGAEESLELVWGIGHARWRAEGWEIDHPLIEQLVEMTLDPTDGSLHVRPRSTEPQIALKPYLAMDNGAADEVLKFSRGLFARLPVDEELSPFQRSSFEPLLRVAVTKLDSGGRYYPDECHDITDRSVPPAFGDLTVTDTWVIFARQRSDNFYLADLERLIGAIQDSPELPGPAAGLVTEPSDAPTYTPTLVNLGSGLNGQSPASSSPQDVFFPKPFNDDQVAIIKRLHEADGVVVQGPPGTGKTHTIANIICHYLATGRRVLVTSKGEAALAVLRSHIPEGIRDLAISLLTSEREGLKQLEQAVSVLASTATQINAPQLEREILAGERHIVDCQGKLCAIEAEMRRWAEQHLKPVGTLGQD
jgi:hypothetical protein